MSRLTLEQAGVIASFENITGGRVNIIPPGLLHERLTNAVHAEPGSVVLDVGHYLPCTFTSLIVVEPDGVLVAA